MLNGKKGMLKEAPEWEKDTTEWENECMKKKKHRQERQGRPSPHKQTPSKNDSGY